MNEQVREVYASLDVTGRWTPVENEMLRTTWAKIKHEGLAVTFLHEVIFWRTQMACETQLRRMNWYTPMTRSYTFEEREKIERLWKGGCTDREIAGELFRTARAINDYRKKHGLVTPKDPPPPKQREEGEEPVPPPPLKPNEPCWLKRHEANQWHLIELKRAGHSPKFTELALSHDDGLPIKINPSRHESSFSSSPSSW